MQPVGSYGFGENDEEDLEAHRLAAEEIKKLGKPATVYIGKRDDGALYVDSVEELVSETPVEPDVPVKPATGCFGLVGLVIILVGVLAWWLL